MREGCGVWVMAAGLPGLSDDSPGRNLKLSELLRWAER